MELMLSSMMSLYYSSDWVTMIPLIQDKQDIIQMELELREFL